MENKMVSVIVAAYNAEKFLPECIESIRNQTYSNWEMWICDDCSSDGTLDIAEDAAQKDSRIHVLHNEKNIFAGASRNRCLGKCTGDYVMIQDADDVCHPERIEKLLQELEKGQVDFVSSGHYLYDDSGTYKTTVPAVEEPKKRDFLSGMPFCHAATLFTKSSLKAIGGYRINKETRRAQDYDMFMRLYAAGYKGKNIRDILYGYRVDRNTISRRKFRYRIDECKIRYRGFRELGLLPKGILYVFKPIPAYFLQVIKGRNRG